MGTTEPPAKETENLCKETTATKEDETSETKTKNENGSTATQENEESLGGPTFTPPLYLKRYSKVARIVGEFDVKKVQIKTL